MSRPIPPASLLDSLFLTLVPAPEVWEWISTEILADTGSINNEDHVHLIGANIGILWASQVFAKQGRTVLGQAEQIMHRASGWQKARMEQQMRECFGEGPEFIITLAADYCSTLVAKRTVKSQHLRRMYRRLRRQANSHRVCGAYPNSIGLNVIQLPQALTRRFLRFLSFGRQRLDKHLIPPHPLLSFRVHSREIQEPRHLWKRSYR